MSRLGGETGRRTGLKILGWVNHRTGSIPVPAIMLDHIAFTIPHTRRHLKFMSEVEAEMDKRGIEFRTQVQEYEQESVVRYYTSEKDKEAAGDLVEEVSR